MARTDDEGKRLGEVTLRVEITTEYTWSRPDWSDEQILTIAEDLIWDHAAETYGIGRVKKVEVKELKRG